MKVISFDRTNVRQIDEAIKLALKQVEAEFGVIVTCSGCSYSENEIKPRIVLNTCTVDDGSGISDAARRTWALLCESFNFTEADLGRTFVDRRHTYTITGLTCGGRYPILCRRDDDRIFKYDADAVQRLLLTAPTPTRSKRGN